MKFFLYFILLLFNTQYLFSITLTLKDKIYINNKKVTLHDLILEQNIDYLPDIEILNLKNSNEIIKSDYIINKLLNNNIFDVVLIGNSVSVYTSKKKDISQIIPKKEKNNPLQTPVECLTDYFNSIINLNNMSFLINVINVDPYINLYDYYKDFDWKIKKLKYGLTDIGKINRVLLEINGKIYNVLLDIDIFANVYFSNKNFLKNDYFNDKDFIQKYVNITSFQNFDTLVTNFDDTKNYKIISNLKPGEILRWQHLGKIPVKKSGEQINLIYKNNNFEIILQCKLLSDAYINERVKVKLSNGNEKYGILKIEQGVSYVEMQ